MKKDPSLLPVWIPILQEFAPAILVECENFIRLAKRLSTEWLIEFMFKGERGGRKKAIKIARYLTNEKITLSHASRIDAEHLRNQMKQEQQRYLRIQKVRR